MRILILLALTFFVSNLALAQDFYLAPNGVTCMCPNAAVGASGDPGSGIVYTKRLVEDITIANAATTCTSGITDMNLLFWDPAGLSFFNEDISSWDTSQVTTMGQMFLGCNVFNADISNWDVSNVTNMGGMFAHCSVFNQDLSGWDVSNVTNMVGTFFEAFEFNQDLSSWDVSSVTDMLNMFKFAHSFDQDLSLWNFNNNVDLPYFLSYSGMSQSNYDALLQALLNQSSAPSELGAHEVEYCDVNTRQQLVDNGWTISGDQLVSATISAPMAVVLEADPSTCDISNYDLGSPSLMGCGNLTVSNNAPASLPLGISEVVWTVSDDYGNTDQDTQLVEVVLISDKADICYITSDWNNPTKNRVWITSDPLLNGQNVNYHEVLRELPSGMFETIGFINPPETSFLDTSSDNTTQAYRYKVKTADICGQVLPESDYHKTILLQSGIATDNSVNLAWNPYVGLEFSTYNVYRSVNGAAFILLVSLAASNITYNDTSANVLENFYEYFVSIDVSNCNSDPFQPFSLRSNQEYVNPNLTIGDLDLLNNSIVVYPNPTFNEVKIEIPFDVQVFTIDLYSNIGQKILVSSGTNSLDLSNLPVGMYYIKVNTNLGKIIKSVVKK